MTNLLIATSIFPPDIGGPALYAKQLAEEFSRQRIAVAVVTYGKNFLPVSGYSITGVSRIWPKGLRHLIYAWKVFWQARNADAILALDSLAAGLPSVLVGKIFRKKVLIRFGGDFLWEKFVESGQEPITITEFYNQGLHKARGFLNFLITLVVRHTDNLIFTTNWQKNLFIKYYGLGNAKTAVINNIFEKKGSQLFPYQENPKIILWAGRFIRLKNLDFLIKIFKRLLVRDANLVLELVGDGPEKSAIAATIQAEGLGQAVKLGNNLEQKELFARIQKSYFCILPSISEISPNFALQCVSFNKPIVLTQETGIRDQFPGLLYADPLSEDSFFSAAAKLLDKNFYDNYQKYLSEIRYSKTWPDMAREYLQIICQ